MRAVIMECAKLLLFLGLEKLALSFEPASSMPDGRAPSGLGDKHANAYVTMSSASSNELHSGRPMLWTNVAVFDRFRDRHVGRPAFGRECVLHAQVALAFS